MTTYSAIADATIAVNKPVTNSLMTLLRDNPLALHELMGWAVTSKVYISPEQTISAGSTFTVAHGLTSFSPTNGIYQAFLVCQSNNAGYTTGQVVPFNLTGDASFSTNYGMSIIASATNLIVRIGSNGLQLPIASSGAATALTLTSWKMVVTVRG